MVQRRILKITLRGWCHAKKQSLNSIQIKDVGSKLNVIKASDGDLLTSTIIATAKVEDGFIVSNTEKDILKIAVLNRYNKDAKPIVEFINGFGFNNGAIAGSIAHDSHNIIAVGVSDKDIIDAMNIVIENRGGLAISCSEFSDSLKLDVAGLMSSSNAHAVAENYKQINESTKRLSSKLKNPFMTMSFMALLVIPELKIGDKGLFNISEFKHVELFAN